MTKQIKRLAIDSNDGDIVVDGKFLTCASEWREAGFTVRDWGSSSVPGAGTVWLLTGPEGFKFSTYGGRTSPGEYRDYVFINGESK